MQHIPSIAIILKYFCEIGRILKPGGLFRVQVNGYWHVRLYDDVYLMWGTCGTHRLRRLKIENRPHLRLGKLDSWRGVPVAISDIKKVCASAGLICTESTGVGTQYMWVNGTKKE